MSIWLGVSTSLLAQNGAIRGMVVDNTRLSLPGASIRLPELGCGAVSNEDGVYLLADVLAGTHQLTVSYLGYQVFTTSVTVTSRTTTTLPVELAAGITQTGEVQVLGVRLQGQAKALNEQRTNANITNVYTRPSDKAVFVIVGRKEGPTDDGKGQVSMQLERKFGHYSGRKEIESIAVDNELGYIYYSDEGVGVRQYYADPARGNEELSLFA
jgi:hypothetical protein